MRLPSLPWAYAPSRYGTKYLGGWVQAPKFPVFVSVGVGSTGIPLRFGVAPEVVVFGSLSRRKVYVGTPCDKEEPGDRPARDRGAGSEQKPAVGLVVPHCLQCERKSPPVARGANLEVRRLW